MKLLAIPLENDFLSDLLDGYILPLEKFSVGYSKKYTLEEIRLCAQQDKEVFVIMNKNIFNHEIEEVEKTLRLLSKIPIQGVFFYDLSILSIAQRCEFTIPLVWNQTHMVTNYNTINYYVSKGVLGAMLSNEITLDEMIEIRKKTKAKLFVNLIYRPIMSFSRRHLISNFYKSKHSSCDLSNMTIYEKVNNEKLFVQEEEEGTAFFYGKIVNGLSALPTMLEENFDYGIVDLSILSEDARNLCLSTIREIMEKKEVEDFSVISDLIGDYTGFLYKKTVYKVK